jgi:hypothetical protein
MGQVYGSGLGNLKMAEKNVHNEDCSDRPTVVNNVLFEKVNNKIFENRRFTISELSTCFSTSKLS